ncbi:transferase family protein [Westerdykella ornata]|uniref:Transferase family protein n=1 Tax=Westerdykella ornata TaxID=318751 RepID=A0A6A6J401_WESOR|nr:transferase family protein [Westerdykella ornata]KAF2271301.1 transferase family protein [Westerdykella ornata]
MNCRSLGPLDHNAPHNIPQSMIFLSLKQDVRPSDAFTQLQDGLRLTLQRMPWLGGTIHWQSPETPGWRPGTLEIRYPNSIANTDLLRLKELNTSKSYGHLRDAGFPLDAFDDEEIIWTRPWSSNFHEGVPVFAAQANFLPGGCILAFSIPSPASDGTAMLMIINLWADFCSGDPILASQMWNLAKGSAVEDHSISRSLLDQVLTEESIPKSQTGHRTLHQLVGMDPIPDQDTRSDGNAMQHVIFYMPHKAYTALRKDCVEQYGDRAITGNDLICAFIWRSLMRAQRATKAHEFKENSSTMTVLLRPFDARPHVAKLLPSMYLGNLNFESRITMPLSSLVDPNTSIPSIAHIISKSLDIQTTQDNLANAYRLLRSSPDYGQVQWGATHATGTTVGILSPIVLPFNDTCFGMDVFGNGGRPDAFRPIMGASNRPFRTSFVIPRKKHGGVEFVMTVSTEELGFLCDDAEFNRFGFSLQQ